MARFITVTAMLCALAGAAIAPAPPAWAMGPYDGTWIVDLPANNGPSFGNANSACPALRLRILVKDNQLSASLQRVPGAPNVVENSADPNATPVTGSVRPDGSVEAKWGNYVATGTLAGANTAVTVQGTCGSRTGTAVRIG